MWLIAGSHRTPLTLLGALGQVLLQDYTSRRWRGKPSEFLPYPWLRRGSAPSFRGHGSLPAALFSFPLLPATGPGSTPQASARPSSASPSSNLKTNKKSPSCVDCAARFLPVLQSPGRRLWDRQPGRHGPGKVLRPCAGPSCLRRPTGPGPGLVLRGGLGGLCL